MRYISRLGSLLANEDGTTLVEESLLLALLALACVPVLSNLAGGIGGNLHSAKAGMGGGGCGLNGGGSCP
jgi:Flp pilus assembly pilin Flp